MSETFPDEIPRKKIRGNVFRERMMKILERPS